MNKDWTNLQISYCPKATETLLKEYNYPKISMCSIYASAIYKLRKTNEKSITPELKRLCRALKEEFYIKGLKNKVKQTTIYIDPKNLSWLKKFKNETKLLNWEIAYIIQKIGLLERAKELDLVEIKVNARGEYYYDIKRNL